MWTCVRDLHLRRAQVTICGLRPLLPSLATSFALLLVSARTAYCVAARRSSVVTHPAPSGCALMICWAGPPSLHTHTEPDIDPDPDRPRPRPSPGTERRRSVHVHVWQRCTPPSGCVGSRCSSSPLCREQGLYGRPARPRRRIGRGWPKLGAAWGVLWR